MDINDFTIPTIKKHKGSYVCDELAQNLIKQEAEPIVIDFLHRLNQEQLGCSIIHRGWPYLVLGLLFIIAVVVLLVVHVEYYLFAIPLFLLLAMLIGSMASYFMTSKRIKAILFISEEFKVKLSPYYVLVDNYNIRAYEHRHRIYNSYYDRGFMIKLVPIELLAQQLPYNNADINFRQEQMALLEQAQLNRQSPINQNQEQEDEQYRQYEDEEEVNRTR